MKGIILAGGNGTRLKPLTNITNKHLLPVHDKQMILYPLQTLLDMGVTEIMIVTGKEYAGAFIDLLGSGSEWGCKLTYRVQDDAGGIAQALLLAEGYVHDRFAVILGDNIFSNPISLPTGNTCALVLKSVPDPERFGVFHEGMIQEKPIDPRSNLIVTGLYIYTPEVFSLIKKLTPSARGELEITDVNNYCLKELRTVTIRYDGFWSDAGTFESLAKAAEWARTK